MEFINRRICLSKRILEKILHFYREYCLHRPNSWGIQCSSVHVDIMKPKTIKIAKRSIHNEKFHEHFMCWMSHIEQVLTKIHTFLQVSVFEKKYTQTPKYQNIGWYTKTNYISFLSFFSSLCYYFRAIQIERSKTTVETLFNIFTKVHKRSEYKNLAKIESKNDGGTATNGRSWFCWCNHFDIQTFLRRTSIKWMVLCVACYKNTISSSISI